MTRKLSWLRASICIYECMSARFLRRSCVDSFLSHQLVAVMLLCGCKTWHDSWLCRQFVVFALVDIPSTASTSSRRITRRQPWRRRHHCWCSNLTPVDVGDQPQPRRPLRVSPLDRVLSGSLSSIVVVITAVTRNYFFNIIIIIAASERKSAKYSSLSSSHVFFSSGYWDAGSSGWWGTTFSGRDWQESNAVHSRSAEATFLYQRISVATQRFNAVCLANSLTVSESPS